MIRILTLSALIASNSFALEAFIPTKKTSSNGNSFYTSSYKVKFCESVKNKACVNEIDEDEVSVEQRVSLVKEAFDRIDFYSPRGTRARTRLETEVDLNDFSEKHFKEELQDLFMSLDIINFINENNESVALFHHHKSWAAGPGWQEWSGWTDAYNFEENIIFEVNNKYHGGED